VNAKAQAENNRAAIKETAYQNAMQAGHDAMKAKKYDEAIHAFQDALAQMPGDTTANNLMAQATKAMNGPSQPPRPLDRGKTEPKPHSPTPVDPRSGAYQKAMQAGREALTARRFETALQRVNEALSLVPGDRGASELKKQVDNAIDLENQKKKEEEKRRHTDYQHAMDQGRRQLTAKLFSDAEKSFNDALKIMPGDAAALDGLRKAQQARNADPGSKEQPTRPNPKPNPSSGPNPPPNTESSKPKPPTPSRGQGQPPPKPPDKSKADDRKPVSQPDPSKQSPQPEKPKKDSDKPGPKRPENLSS
jgi:tetratricopeptide (TPR) repeat protein